MEVILENSELTGKQRMRLVGTVIPAYNSSIRRLRQEDFMASLRSAFITQQDMISNQPNQKRGWVYLTNRNLGFLSRWNTN